VFVLYRDGITEAMDGDGEEFGECRLLETVRSLSHLPVAELLERVVSVVRQFGGREQRDDITL
jgi:phosphoserine phosphatase RsbU/P